jgi:hypothetical protein
MACSRWPAPSLLAACAIVCLSACCKIDVSIEKALHLCSRPAATDTLCSCFSCMLLQWVMRHTLFGELLSGSTVVVVTKHQHCILYTNMFCCCCICPVIYLHAVGNPPHVVWWAAVWFDCYCGCDKAPRPAITSSCC